MAEEDPGFAERVRLRDMELAELRKQEEEALQEKLKARRREAEAFHRGHRTYLYPNRQNLTLSSFLGIALVVAIALGFGACVVVVVRDCSRASGATSPVGSGYFEPGDLVVLDRDVWVGMTLRDLEQFRKFAIAKDEFGTAALKLENRVNLLDGGTTVRVLDPVAGGFFSEDAEVRVESGLYRGRAVFIPRWGLSPK